MLGHLSSPRVWMGIYRTSLSKSRALLDGVRVTSGDMGAFSLIGFKLQVLVWAPTEGEARKHLTGSRFWLPSTTKHYQAPPF